MKPITYLAVHALLAPTLVGAPAAPAKRWRIHLRQFPNQLNVGQRLVVRGRVENGGGGLQVVLQRKADGRWQPLTKATTKANGAFTLRFGAPPAGNWAVRLKVTARGVGVEPTPGCAVLCASTGSRRRGGRSLLDKLGIVEVFRPAVASWYGGGGTLACGGYLTSQTLGVANRTLPCGTEVTLRYGNRTIRVPVIDRGPYVEGREFDLTEATKEALGFPGLGVVWTTAP